MVVRAGYVAHWGPTGDDGHGRETVFVHDVDQSGGRAAVQVLDGESDSIIEVNLKDLQPRLPEGHGARLTPSESRQTRAQPVAAAPILDPRRAEVVRVIMRRVRAELPAAPTDEIPLLALAALAHCAHLLEGELLLAENRLWHLVPVLGRTLKETWLYGQYLLLDPEPAVELMDGEVEDHQRRLEVGRAQLRKVEHLAELVSTHGSPGASDQ